MPPQRRLLWEIFRLRSVMVEINRLEYELTVASLGFDEDAQLVLDELRALLRREPAVRETTRPRRLVKRETEWDRRHKRR